MTFAGTLLLAIGSVVMVCGLVSIIVGLNEYRWRQPRHTRARHALGKPGRRR